MKAPIRSHNRTLRRVVNSMVISLFTPLPFQLCLFPHSTFWKNHPLTFVTYTDSGVNEAFKQAQAEKTARGEKTAGNVRFGESISEHGFGGKTVGNSGSKGMERSEEVGQTRREQGYGGGSGVGG